MGKLLTACSDRLAHVPHGFFGRSFERLAQYRDDDENTGLTVRPIGPNDAERVARNRQRCVTSIATGRALALVEQVHGNRVHTVRTESDAATMPEADALVTCNPDVVLGVYTADCVPILMANETGEVVAAVHAGWRGANSGVVEAALEVMGELGARAQTISAAIGPAIAAASYEVDAPFADSLNSAGKAFLTPSAVKQGRWQFDLPGFVAETLQKNGVSGVERSNDDTFALAQYYSHRRASSKGLRATGRQISLIASQQP